VNGVLEGWSRDGVAGRRGGKLHWLGVPGTLGELAELERALTA
jgi:hypothetical protein